MKTIRPVKITVSSVIDNTEAGLPVGDPEHTSITANGSLTSEDGTLTIKYTETEEGNTTDCTLRISSEGVALSRRGAVVSDILFAEGEECNTIYSVPPYKFDMQVYTRRIRSTLTELGGELQLVYSMTVGGQDKSVRMKISVSA